MQFCEAHHNKTAGGDGGGFDIDGGSTNCIMQYTYSHDNHGCGYLICQFRRAGSFADNICRYNISEGDATASRGAMGSITFWSGGSGGIKDTQVYNNTLYVSDATRGAGIEVWSGGISNTAVHNNIIMTTAGKQVLNFSSTSGGWALQGNCYWSGGGPLEIIWGSTTYTSLADFRAGTGQEMLDGQPVGFEADPCLTDPGNGGTVGDPHLLPALDAYKLKDTSGLIDSGLDILALFGIDPGQQDFYGSSIPLPPSGAYDVGAHEYDANVQPDTDPPTPNPMTWETVPYATGDDSIAMEASEAFDLSGVEYYFECTAGGGHDSGWQDGTFYEDTGLSSSTTYTYRVQARDKSPNQNATGWSTAESATTDPEDTTPPTPDPMTWATVPYSTGSSSITMVATTASDISGVEYYFAELSGNPGGSDSGWQDDTTYEDTGLDPNTEYTYQVKARDKSGNLNETAYSTAESATTDPAGSGELPWFDGFESGDFIAGGWTTSGTAVVKAQAKYNGSYGAEMQLVSSMETAINTSGFTDIHLKFYCRTKGLDGGELLYAEWYDGSNWHELDAINPGGWTFYDKTCGAGADDNPSFKIRFSLIASHAKEEWARIDDVEVTGTAQ
jgi:hypothetical protein